MLPALLLLSVVFAGCATPPPLPAQVRNQASSLGEVIGDWDDVETCVSTGAYQSEMAIERVMRPDPDTIVFELLTITNEPARLEMERIGGDGKVPGESERMELRASVGLFGSRDWEERLIGRVSRRLTELRGVDVAPIRWP